MKDLPMMIETVASGFGTSIKYCIGSGSAFFVANTLPEESIFRAASAVTGWALAIVCIWYLAKTCKFLYAKLEEKDLKLDAKDKVIEELYAAAATKADQQRQDMLDELKKINGTK